MGDHGGGADEAAQHRSLSGVDDRPDRPPADQGHDLALEEVGGVGLLGRRAGAQHRPPDDEALGEEGPHVEVRRPAGDEPDDDDPAPSCQVVSVSVNDSAIAAPGGEPDVVLDGNLTVSLRANRAYTVTVTCADKSGHSSSRSILVAVPASQP